MKRPLLNNVKAGIELLDTELSDWYRDIDTDTLTMNSGCNCILGQMYGDYIEGSEYLYSKYNTDKEDIPILEYMINHGFEGTHWSEYGILQRYWTSEVEKRERARENNNSS